MDLRGKVAFITGGAQGLGREISRTLAEAGMRLAIVDRNPNSLAVLQGDATLNATEMLVGNIDIRDELSIKQFMETVDKEFGSIDVLVNNAAIDATLGIDEMSSQKWRDIIDTNLTAPFMLTKLALPYFQKNKNGHVINIASTASKRAWPNASAYHASKWGLLGLSQALFSELRQFGVRVTAVIAGGMRTPFLLDRFPDINLDNLQDPKNVANTIRFVLTTPDGSAIPEVMVIPTNETSWP